MANEKFFEMYNDKEEVALARINKDRTWTITFQIGESKVTVKAPTKEIAMKRMECRGFKF